MRSTLAQLDAAEKPLLKRYRTLVKHCRYVADYLRAHPRQAITLRQCAEERLTVATAIRAIRAIRAQRKALDAGHATRVGAERVASSIDGASVHCYTVDP